MSSSSLARLPDYEELREQTRQLLMEGVNAVETCDRLKALFGVQQAPTLCTVYKWRREFRGGKGEREADDYQKRFSDPNGLLLSPKAAKVRKQDCEKYCTQCNREMCSRHYYELHMLKIHDVFVGESRAILDYLEAMEPERKRQVIYRCDSCFGGELDYDNLEDLKRHRLLEHGQSHEQPDFLSPSKSILAPAPSLASSNIQHSPPQTPVQLRHNSKLGRARSVAPSFGRKKHNNDIEDVSPANLRRSSRIPKPSPLLMESMLSAKLSQEISLPDTSPIKSLKKRAKGNDNNEDEEKFVTILNDGRLETEEPEYKPTKSAATSADVTVASPATSSGTSAQPQKKRMMSPDALDAADSMLKLAFAAAASNNLLASVVGREPKTNPPAYEASPNSTQTSTTKGSSTSKGSSQQSTSSSSLRNLQQQKMFNDGLDKGLVRIPKKRGRKPKRKLLALREHEKLSEENDTKDKYKENNNNCDNFQQHLPATIALQQDDCSWFGQSIAASLRQMSVPGKELAKMRIQQVIYECTAPAFGKKQSHQQSSWLQNGESHKDHRDEGICGTDSSSGAGDDAEEKHQQPSSSIATSSGQH